jgi:hypothetical protein
MSDDVCQKRTTCRKLSLLSVVAWAELCAEAWMQRREFLGLVGGAATACSAAVRASH